MKINQVKIENFRGYKEETIIPIQDLTVFVGKNDAGKSTILEALDIFFNDSKAAKKIGKDDINKTALNEGHNDIIISVIFEGVPETLIIDSTNETTLESEYLLNTNSRLEIIKKYPNGGKAKVFIKANHPTNENCNNLLEKKQNELRTIIRDNSIDCSDLTKNAVMRSAIWSHYNEDLQLQETELDVTKGDTKDIWVKLESYLPLYTLFQSDRSNNDSDSEVQDPMQFAVQEILKNEDLRKSLNEVAGIVEGKLKEVASNTLDKLREMNPDVANSLNPVIPELESLKWGDVFKKVSIAGDEDIPINKRGSGVKRLILLNFFRAEAERRRSENNIPSIIYAIEEPETSQHNEHQKILIRAFKDLSITANTQIFLTTHSPVIVKELEFNHLRMVLDIDDRKEVTLVDPGQLPYPSLNEVNFVAFNESTDEYHNELFGFIESQGNIANFKNSKPTIPYVRVLANGNTQNQQIILTEYIRHQIHHPENTNNTRFTEAQLKDSINLMRSFISGVNE